MTFRIAKALLLSQCVIINHINLWWSWDKHILPENGFTAKTEEQKSHFPGRFKNVLLQIFHGITYIYHCTEGPLPMPKFNKRAKICDKLTSTSMIQAIIGKHTLPATVHSTRKLRIAKYHLTKWNLYFAGGKKGVLHSVAKKIKLTLTCIGLLFA